ncbi:helix-turn-helix domain-containing protein [Streptomyces sp. R302]|uniref:helix-turn-helix domain-containing protein n=1 Tax=unclassified Streptomyces TaxID=2593676 RepID=UPI00145DC1B6|nr:MULTISPECIES: pyridoxamine 5'-phosphate oxidase family protein [unclassified Streptomyces]NML51099.1 helix-turn-helix domain-containing protein [Streptomyces sp. R301]NML81194.1 helix-turn-helix domain-containing protein [Streptomyces sp. R302]
MNTTGDRRHRSDLGRRVATRRRQLGLSREEVAERAGSSPGYIAYVEEQLPTPGIEFLVRLAHALDTTIQDLTGLTADLAPGGAPPGNRPELVELEETECWSLLDERGVGRIGVEGADGPVVFPVNYQVLDGSLVFSTAAESALGRAAAAGAEVAFEEDRLDEAFRRGWSVLLVGPVHLLSDPAEAMDMSRAVTVRPWSGDGRNTVVRLVPRRVTGRRILVPGTPGA